MADAIGLHIDDIPDTPAQPDQQSAIGTHIDDIPDTPQAAPQQQAQPQSAVGTHIDDIPDNPTPKAEGPGASFVRAAASSAIPTAASVGPMMAGGELGFELGAPLGPIAAGIGALGGAAVAGIASSGVVSAVQDKVKDVLGLNDTQQRQVNAQANPTASLLGELAPMAVAFKAGDITDAIAQRLVTGGGMAGVDIAQQYIEKGTVDPKEALIQGAAGALLNKPRGWIEPYAAAGAKVGAEIGGGTRRLFPPGRPDMDNTTKEADLDTVTPNVTATSDSLGNAQSKAPPVVPEDRSTIGTPKADGNTYVDGDGGSKGRWAKAEPGETGAETISTGSQPSNDPTFQAWVDASKPEDVIAAHNAPGEVQAPEPPPLGEPTEQPLSMYPEGAYPPMGEEATIPQGARPTQFTPPETTPPEVIEGAKGLPPGTPAEAKAAAAISKARDNLPPKVDWAAVAAENRAKIPPAEKQPKEVVQKAIDLLTAQGKDKMVAALAKMPEGNAKDMMAARMAASAVAQTEGHVPVETLKNVRIRSPEHLAKLEVKGWNNPDTGQPYRTGTKALAALYSKVHDVNAKVFNDPAFKPPETPETSADQVKARAKAMLDKGRELMDANGKLPNEVYSMNGLRKPPEWSLMREANKLIKGNLKPDLDATGKVIAQPWEKFLANERLHRGAPEDYAAFEKNNQAEAATAKQVAPTMEVAEARAAAEPATTREAITAPQEEFEETLSERAKREAMEDRVLDKLRSMKHDKVADTLERAPLGEKRNAAFKMMEDKVLRGKQGGPGMQPMARPRKPLSKDETDALIKKITDQAITLNDQINAAKGEAKPGGPAKAAEAVATSKAQAARAGLMDQLKTFLVGGIHAKAMKGIIRQAGGMTARTMAQAQKIMEGFSPMMRRMTEDQRTDFMKSLDTETGNLKIPAEARPLANWWRSAAVDVTKQINALPKHEQQQWVKTYFPHMFTNNDAAAAFADQWYAERASAKEGSTASLKERTFPTIQEGLDAGLKLATTNPLEIMGRYLNSMHTYIANQKIIQAGKDAGIITTFPKAAFGAAGNVGGRAIPDHYLPLDGRAALGEPLYAPADAATIYNNYISKGFADISPKAGRIAEAFQHVSNGMTGLELSMNGYHAFTMAKEAIINKAALAISHAFAGDFSRALQRAMEIPMAPINMARTGSQVGKVYMGEASGSPLMRQVVDLVEKAGGRMKGISHDPTYQFSSQHSFFKSWQQGSLGMDLADVRARIKNPEQAGGPAIQAGKEVFRGVGRVMQTVAEPLFQHYIPALKNGAIYDNLGDWLTSHPNATEAEQLAKARDLVDSVDNRFGEMVHDNIFWHKASKQSAMIGMRAYSWFLGTVREIGGGTISAFQNPERISINHPDYDARAAYAVTMPIIVALTSMAYQFLKTGKGPGDLRDLVTPQTGGTVGGAPERAALPGYEKDVYGWAHDPKREAINKLATAPRLVWDTLSNSDYKGSVIAEGNAPAYKQALDYAKHVGAAMGPISIKNVVQGSKGGSNITLPERMTAIREAPGYMENPARINAAVFRRNQRDWKTSQHQAVKASNQYQ